MFKLGSGKLTWMASERRSDRYGSVHLLAYGDSESDWAPAPLNIPNDMVNTHGQLVVIVTETRDSTHIGDLFHGVFPRTPECGATIHLGSGLLFSEQQECDGKPFTIVGLKPTDARKTMWLDIRQLYNAHEQTVDLFFVPDLKT